MTAPTRQTRAGWADYHDLRRYVSTSAVRQAALDTRPSIRYRVTSEVTGRVRPHLLARVPVNECGTWIGSAAINLPLSVRCYAAHRDSVGMIAAPQSWKSATAQWQIIAHCGAVFSQTTKPDTFLNTAALRAQVSRSSRYELLDLQGLSGYDSTFRWTPLVGCTDPVEAAMRAAAHIEAIAPRKGDDKAWYDEAAATAACFLHAAALEARTTAKPRGRTMRDVAAWSVSSTQAREVLGILTDENHRAVVPTGWAPRLANLLLDTDSPKFRSSVLHLVTQAFAYMQDPHIAELCCPEPGQPEFSVGGLLADNGTVYVIAEDREHSPVSTLVASMTSYVFHEAKRLAGRFRLDPPLLLDLDEVTNTNPVPLGRWLSDSGGRGIQVSWKAQSPSQLAERWGTDGMRSILNATNALLFGGALKVDEDLEGVSKLCGMRPANGDDDRPGPLIDVASLRTLPQWNPILVYRGMRPTVVDLWPPPWRDRKVRRAGMPPVLPSIAEVFAALNETQDRVEVRT